MCCALALRVSALILASLGKAEISPELLDLQFQHTSDQSIAHSYPNAWTGSSISRVDDHQYFGGNSGGVSPTLQSQLSLLGVDQQFGGNSGGVSPTMQSQLSLLGVDQKFESAVGQSQSLSGLQSSGTQAMDQRFAMDQQFASTAPELQPLRSLQSSDGQKQLNAMSQLGPEIKQTSQVAALLAQDAALLAKELVAINSALRGVQGFNPHSTAQISELQMAEDSATARVQARLQALNSADVSPAAVSASGKDGSSSSSEPRCGGKDQVACNSTNAYFTMNYRVPLWLGVILWVLIWICIICFCVGLCINIFKPNLLTQ